MFLCGGWLFERYGKCEIWVVMVFFLNEDLNLEIIFNDVGWKGFFDDYFWFFILIRLNYSIFIRV